jgi:hypothetical protein
VHLQHLCLLVGLPLQLLVQHYAAGNCKVEERA